MTALLVRGGELVPGRIADVRCGGDRIVEIAPGLRPRPGETVVDADGGAVLPGLHDHHLHLLSLAAAVTSMRCGPPEVIDHSGLSQTLRAAPPGWVRGIGYHESVAGSLDRFALDRMVADRPVRVQHRSGALWMLNSRAVAELWLGNEPGVERDDEGRPTGRMWRADALLRERLGTPHPPDLSAVGHRLSALGITGVTDATPDLDGDTVGLLASAAAGGELPQRLQLLGAPTGAPLPPRVTVGPSKILPPDHEPPDWAALRAKVLAAHAQDRPVAIHAVTRESLVVALAVLREVGTLPEDRIEHAAVVGQDLLPLLAEIGPVVVTQPGFIAERGDQYRRDLPAAIADLYRYASLLGAGLRVAPSSDAPFASEDPWRTMAAALQRRTTEGVVFGAAERVAAGQVLDGLLAPLERPGGGRRRIEIGAPADLCVLRVPLDEALRDPDARLVGATVCAGRVAYHAESGQVS
ncbi:amidohydrolase family protein [Saccharomonospora sp. NPDC046836]|uniref:amidohydrolase family protein n=1 Tax=Saccharomonospora sp. NPDC046836 TaxID=3156921 RepID=UPI0033D17BD3